MRNVFSPSAFSSSTVRRVPSASHQLTRPDAEDAAVRPLLDLGDVLVVDPEAQLADLAVGPAEQGEDRVGEGELLVDALGVEGGEPGVDVAACATPGRGRTA